MHSLKAAISGEHRRVIEKAWKLFPQLGYLFDPMPTFYTTGKTAGRAYGSERTAYNLTVFAHDPERFIKEVVPHEIAHNVCIALGWDRGHGKNWKRVCVMLGGNGKRCYDGSGIEFEGTRKRKKYEYRATCGTVMLISDVRHNRIQRGMQYSLHRTNGTLKYSGFTGRVV